MLALRLRASPLFLVLCVLQNVLLDSAGRAKVCDFGERGQLKHCAPSLCLSVFDSYCHRCYSCPMVQISF
jgi:hypothetical protein